MKIGFISFPRASSGFYDTRPHGVLNFPTHRREKDEIDVERSVEFGVFLASQLVFSLHRGASWENVGGGRHFIELRKR